VDFVTNLYFVIVFLSNQSKPKSVGTKRGQITPSLATAVYSDICWELCTLVQDNQLPLPRASMF
jgi:hypothetical protein